MVAPMEPVIRIAAALIDDGAGALFLVRRRGTRAFMQAGGKIDPGETALQALARELGEELLFAPARGELAPLGTFSAPAENEPGRTVEAALFHLRTPRRPFRIAAELEEALWIPIDEAERLPLAPLTRRHILPLARALLRPR
jgi:8-oxo-dGTP pyrophosphatase MutT (NUDIX family)